MLNDPMPQPSTSASVQIFRNASFYNSVDITVNTLRIIPNNGSEYPSSSFQVDISGNVTATGNVTAASGELGSASGTWTPANGTFNVAAGTVINVASVPSGATTFNAVVIAGYIPSPAWMFGGMTSSGAYWGLYASPDYGTASSISSTTIAGSAQQYYDGTYAASGYFQINGGYLQFVTLTFGTSSQTQQTIAWGVS
jgi:hypothetical protein